MNTLLSILALDSEALTRNDDSHLLFCYEHYSSMTLFS